MKTEAQSWAWLVLPQPQRDQFLEAIAHQVSPEHYQRIKTMTEAFPELLRLLERTHGALGHLRHLMFGPRTENTATICAPTEPAGPPPSKPKPKGHGRNGARSYTGARRVPVAHPQFKAGDRCPDCAKGKLRKKAKPAVAIHVKAAPPVTATIHEMEVLRCDACGKTFTAPTPPEAGPEKYDPSVGVVVSLLRYGSGMPFHRLERLQSSLGVPLPASTQWEQVEAVAKVVEPVFDHLVTAAAQAPTLYNDDTSMRVGELRRQIKAEVRPERTGIFTTGIVAEAQPHPIALFFTGRRHAGENLNELLRHRQPTLPPPLHMCDAQSRNEPAEFATLLSHCLVHARRNFVEVASHFPEECRHVLEALREIYRFDAQAKEKGLDPQQRLHFHQAHSQPVMNQLHDWLSDQMENKKVEPNSGLGQAMQYMLGYWEPLTRFLHEPRAPLDNNVTERALKMAILHRKNSLSYRTQRGAQVGDCFMSLIHTCRLAAVNAFDYLSALVAHGEQVRAHPERWLPWNYRQSLAPPLDTS
jgi:hypothetical protein